MRIKKINRSSKNKNRTIPNNKMEENNSKNNKAIIIQKNQKKIINSKIHQKNQCKKMVVLALIS